MKTREIFDLSVFSQDTMPIKLPSGTELHLLKPTEAIVLAIAGLQDIDKEPPETVMKALHACTKVILNNNETGIVVPDAEIRGLNIIAKNALIKRFSEWIGEIEALPNSRSRRLPRTQTTGRKRG